MTKTLLRLRLSHNRIGAEGAASLVEAMRLNASLLKLDLDGNPLSDESIAAFKTLKIL